jgi:hypothetical protein
MVKKRPIKIPSVLCCLGRAVEVLTVDQKYRWPASKNVKLLATSNGKTLYCLQCVPVHGKNKTTQAAEIEKSIDLYERWHDFDATTAQTVSIPRGFLFEAGRAVSIIYSSNKWEGKSHKYIHTFESKPIVWVNKKVNPTLIMLSGGKIRTTSEGITG